MAAMHNTSALTPVPISAVKIKDAFWAPKLKVWREVTVVDSLAKFERDGSFANFDRVRDGLQGEHKGRPWTDGLIYEMITGCADFLASKRDPKLESKLDAVVGRVLTR